MPVPQTNGPPSHQSPTPPSTHQQSGAPSEGSYSGPRPCNDDVILGLGSPIDNLKKTAAFIDALWGATLEQSNMQQDDIDRLCAAESDPCLDVTDKHFVKALRIFLSTTNASQATYNAIRSTINECYPNDPFLSFGQMKRRVELVFCLARPEAVSRPKPGRNRPGQAKPNIRLREGFGPA